uniref:Acid-sensing ion channel 1 n=1 Tax=Lepisosteus oculatus TaxID=7918 RepID=W5MDF1_LEPOC
MPIQIFCTISFSADDAAVWKGQKDPHEDRYGRPGLDGESEKEEEESDFDEDDSEESGVDDLATFVSGCTLHGADHVFVEEKTFGPRQGLWAAAFLLSLGMFLYQVADRVIYYYQYDHVTTLDELDAPVMTFPAITFCNYNTFRRSQISFTDLLFMAPLLGYEENMAPGIPLAPEPDRQGGSFSMDEFFNRTRHRIEDMLLECKYRGKDCGPEDFREIFTRYGKCYTFNSGQDGRPLLVTMKGGTGNGLELMLDIQQDEYLPVWGETDETSFEAGIKVQIHSQDEPPFIDQLGFGVAPGFQTFVSCQEQRLVYLPQPWGDCKATPMDSDFFDTYSITACRIDCETRYLVENCNCRMVHMPVGDAPYCTPEQYKECADPALDFLVEKDNNYCVCETPCNTTRYGKELSFVKIPSKASAKYLAKKFNKSEQYIADNILVLDIFFEALNYETIEQKKAYEVAGLLGDIGGQMGLFIGASILTILELFDYLYEVVKYKVCRCSRKKHKRSNNNDGGVVLSLDDVKRHAPCESTRPPPSYPGNLLPHHPGRGNFEDFTC